MNNAVVIGGSGGIGLSIVSQMYGYDMLYVLDIKAPEIELPANTNYIYFDISNSDFNLLDELENVKALIITAGFGHLKLFADETDDFIERSFAVNTVGIIKVIRHFFNKINSSEDFYTAIMVSISGIVSSPFFSIYSATKAALHRFIESVNVELDKAGVKNRILEISPGSIKGTGFSGGKTDVEVNAQLSREILDNMYGRDMLFIPQYEEIFQNVIRRYNENPHKFGIESYEYKLRSGRL